MKIHTTILLTILCMPLCAQEILNGSWELHSVVGDCDALNVNEYNVLVEYSTAWGVNLDQINLHTGDCVTADTILAYPIDGNWFCAIVARDTSIGGIRQSKLSLELSDSLILNKWYKLSFYDKAPMPPPFVLL